MAIGRLLKLNDVSDVDFERIVPVGSSIMEIEEVAGIRLSHAMHIETKR